MDENKIRQIVRDEINKSQSGLPYVPPHLHDGSSNLLINQQTLGFIPVPQHLNKTTFNYTAESNGVRINNLEDPVYGFGSPNILEPADATHVAQYVTNPFVFINPIPVVVGNGVGNQSAFNGGSAPDGTIVAFLTGSTTTSFLYVRFSGSWYGVNLAATPVTP